MDRRTLDKGLQALCSLDIDIEQALASLGPPEPRVRPKGFETFLSTLVSQQISTSAAAAIMTRVKNLMPDCTAASLTKISDAELRGAGLSYRKIEYARGLTEAILSGNFNPEALVKMTDDAAINQIRGIVEFASGSSVFCFLLDRKFLQ